MQVAAVVVLLLLLPCSAIAQLRSEIVATGFSDPVGVVTDPGDPTVFFVIEQAGLIRAVRNGRMLDQPFIDLRNQVSSGGERGLLGLAFAPDTSSRRFFVNFTSRGGDTVVARFRRSEQSPVVADVSSRFDLVWPSGRRFIEQPFSNHTGGH